MSEIRTASDAVRDPLEELVFIYLEEREHGRVSGIDEFCRRHPDSAAELRARLEALAATGLLEATAEGEERFPERLGEFRLLERLGGGGMGVVYLAEQENLGRRVALKLIRPGQLYFPQARERFRREVEAAAGLAHPGIVAVYSFGEAQGLPYFAMEHVVGATLAEVLGSLAGRAPETLAGRDLADALAKRCGAPVARSPLFEGTWVTACLRLAEQVAQALQHAHERGVLHRDIKPANVMLTPDGRARLLDFGLATRAGSVRLTRTGAQLGSLAYMPPELAGGGAAEATAASDVYSLGAALYEMLTLRLPFSAPSEPQLALRIAAGRPEPPRRLNPSLAVDAETVCLAAMDVDPARRYASAAVFARDLGHVLALRPIEARRASALLKARRWAQRHPARALAAALAGVVLVGGPWTFGLAQRRVAAFERAHGQELASAKQAVELANAQLTGTNAELASALARESEQHDRAERNVQRAQRAVEEMLSDVGADELEDVPQMEPVRKRLLEKALAFYRELAAEEPTDLALRRAQARTGRAIGDVLKALGRFPEARDEYARQVERLRALLAEEPADPDTRHALASCLNELASMRKMEGQDEAAQRGWEEALALHEELAGAPDARFAFVHDYCATLQSLAFAHYSAGRLEQAWELDQRALLRARELLAAQPGDLEALALAGGACQSNATVAGHLGRAEEAAQLYAEGLEALRAVLVREPARRSTRVDLVELASNYGLELMTKGDPARTEQVLELAFETAAGLVRDFPADPEYRKRLAVIGVNLGAFFGNERRFGDAAPVLDASREALERLVADHPDVLEYGYFLGATLANCAGVEVALDRLAQAQAHSERSVELLRGVHARLGGHAGVIAQLGSALLQLADVHRARSEHARALELVDEALALAITRADVLYQAVETLGSCSLAVARDVQLDEAARAAGVAGCVTRALAPLRDAVAHGYADVERLRSAPELELLRADAGFRSQLDALAAGQGK